MKNGKHIQRRKFLKSLGLLSLLPFIQSCDNSVSGFWGDDDSGTNRQRPTAPKVDILLEGTEEQIAKAVQNKHTLIQNLYNNPGKELSIGFLQDRAYNTLKLSFVRSNLASYPHLRLINTRTNEIANVIWGREGLYPSIKFVDNAGNTIIKGGKPLEFAVKPSGTLNKTNSPIDWIIAGIKIFAVALLLWIGFSVVKYVASALAFIAFNAMAIGLVIAGAAIIVEIIQWILNRTGITIGDITNLFQRTISEIVNILTGIVNFLVNYFG